MTHHKITISFPGPETSEYDRVNPFLDYRLDVTFTHADTSLTLPGFYAADGNAAHTGANVGNIWKVRFRPILEGEWKWKASFRDGHNIALSEEPGAGESISFDGLEGSFEVSASDKKSPDFRAHGRLNYVGERYLQFSESRKYYLKGGADSPENLLAFAGFDQTYAPEKTVHRPGDNIRDDRLHYYEPHAADWQEGDPTWMDGKGKNLIGALNYLSSKMVNSVYFLTMNIHGDGKDTWPWNRKEERYRFDCSKLDQWEIVFDHAQGKGIMLHFVTQETENENLLDIGYTHTQRKLYYRELIARFGHHLALTWNLGEENGPTRWSPIGQTDRQRKDMAAYIKENDPYRNFVSIHTHSNWESMTEIINPLLGFQHIDGPSMQIGSIGNVHEWTKHWIQHSADSGKQWVAFLDEIGPASHGVVPDSVDPGHDAVRYHALWGNLLAGGGGAEWYFGYRYPDNDMTCEDFRGRENMWEQTRIAREFFYEYLPFRKMENHDELTSSEQAFCFALPGEIYVMYLVQGDRTTLDLGGVNGEFEVRWFDPKNGGSLQEGTIPILQGGREVFPGQPPERPDDDWIVLARRAKN